MDPFYFNVKSIFLQSESDSYSAIDPNLNYLVKSKKYLDICVYATLSGILESYVTENWIAGFYRQTQDFAIESKFSKCCLALIRHQLESKRACERAFSVFGVRMRRNYIDPFISM